MGYSSKNMQWTYSIAIVSTHFSTIIKSYPQKWCLSIQEPCAQTQLENHAIDTISTAKVCWCNRWLFIYIYIYIYIYIQKMNPKIPIFCQVISCPNMPYGRKIMYLWITRHFLMIQHVWLWYQSWYSPWSPKNRNIYIYISNIEKKHAFFVHGLGTNLSPFCVEWGMDFLRL